MNIATLAILLVLLIIPEFAFAEVSDKVPSITRLWGSGLLLGLIGYFVIRKRIWAGLVVAVISLFIAFVHYSVLSDPHVGQAVIREQGKAYAFSVYGSIFIMVIPLILGFIMSKKYK